MASLRIWASKLHNLNVLRPHQQNRKYAEFKTKFYMKSDLIKNENQLDKLIKKYAPRLIYNSIIERRIMHVDYEQKFHGKYRNNIDCEEPLPLSLKYFSDDIHVNKQDIEEKIKQERIDFPYSRGVSVETRISSAALDDSPNIISPDFATEANKEVRERQKLLEMNNWMTDYDNYDDSCLTEDPNAEDWKINYGTPDPKSHVSNTPCGGCGALLHCKDTSIPGYIPSEIFRNRFKDGGSNLEAIICQRCYFLKNHNLALQVQVSPDDYPNVLSTISEKQGLVILMVDLLDFPCSIWPGIGDIFGHKTPIVVVGNKVDLLPQDSEKFLTRIKTVLLNSVKLQGFATFNIQDVVLISAKTGFGIEELITKLCSLYRLKGDVYIVGCTNVGKSSLFNAFLQSDYCKIQAMDLIQRATTSVWPGTTLNLLKFPIKRPAGYRQFLRAERLKIMQKVQTDEKQLRKEQLRLSKDPKYATLIGHLDITKHPYANISENNDLFSVQDHLSASGQLKMGVDESSREFAYSKWCFDTPGVVQPDQIIHLLTTEELLLTLPKQLILPRNFCLKPMSSLFIAGLARLDFVDGPGSVRLTVFAANELPITVCDLNDADDVYEELLGTELFKVPTGGTDRIRRWPKLEMAEEFYVTGNKWYRSEIDVVLSSAGWIAVAGRNGWKYQFKAWTPEKRGVYLRECLLPHAVSLFGKRIKRSVAYNKFNFYLK